MNIRDKILDKINIYFRELSKDSHNKILGDDSYNYIQIELDLIIESLDFIYENDNIINKNFLDVGSGIGNICYIASLYDLKPEGIELNPVLFEISKQIYPEINFHNINILDFKKYNEYDIIYYFVPFENLDIQDELRKIILDNIKVGGYIIARDFKNIDDNRFTKIYKNLIWKKINK